MSACCDVLFVVPLLLVASIRHLLCNTSAYFFLIMKAFFLICVTAHTAALSQHVCIVPSSVNYDHFRENSVGINPLNADLIPICHLLALFGAHHIIHISR